MVRTGEVDMHEYYIDQNPPPDKIFVFGSNHPTGRHGAGAARYARFFCGAREGQSTGLQGSSYAIPTRGRYLGNGRFETIEHREVVSYIHEFVQFTKEHTELSFFVTAIGCGFAGWKTDEIAPHFHGAINCIFPIRFRKHLEYI